MNCIDNCSFIFSITASICHCVWREGFPDDVLTDSDDVIIDNIEETVGSDSLNHFGEFEEDSVYVRNDKLKCEYEILYIQEKYSDVLKRKPYISEG